MSVFFFFNDTATTEIYTLSLHDALPICLFGDIIFVDGDGQEIFRREEAMFDYQITRYWHNVANHRSEEHTSKLQSRLHLVCRLLLEKKKNIRAIYNSVIFLRQRSESTTS